MTKENRGNSTHSDDNELSFFTYLMYKTQMMFQEDEFQNNESLKQIISSIPDLMGVLLRSTMDNRLSKDERLFVASALVYLINPEDFLPEKTFGALGLVEDAALAAKVLRLLYHSGTASYLDEHWRGEIPLVESLEHILQKSEKLLELTVKENIDLYLKMNKPLLPDFQE